MGSNNRNRRGINPCQHLNPVSSFAASLCSIRISSAEADARGVRCMNNNNSDNLFILKRAQLLSALLIALVLAKLYFLPPSMRERPGPGRFNALILADWPTYLTMVSSTFPRRGLDLA